MAGGGSGSQSTAPPAYALPSLKYGVEQAYNEYAKGPQLAATPGATINAETMASNRAINGDPTINAAQGYVQNTLGGGFMGQNPYLDATFNKAAQATQGQLASQFAGSGRNVDQSEGLRAQQLGDLSNTIYGGAYENERNRMQGVLPFAQQLGNQQYTDAAALGQVGAAQQDRAQTALDAPGAALDQYLARISSGTMGSNTTTKSGGNKLAGAAGGAAAGSAFGPWGTVIGGVGGYLFS
jgi:hypothetical protein